MTTHKKPSVMLSATVASVVVLVGYATAYAYMVHDVQVGWGTTSYVVAENYNPLTGLIGEGIWKTVFSPIHWIDRRMRREKWTSQ